MPCDTTGGSIVDAPWDRIFVLQGKQMINNVFYHCSISYYLLPTCNWDPDLCCKGSLPWGK